MTTNLSNRRELGLSNLNHFDTSTQLDERIEVLNSKIDTLIEEINTDCETLTHDLTKIRYEAKQLKAESNNFIKLTLISTCVTGMTMLLVYGLQKI